MAETHATKEQLRSALERAEKAFAEARRVAGGTAETLPERLRDIAARMGPGYTSALRQETGVIDAVPLFLTHDQAALRDAADEIERLRTGTEASAEREPGWRYIETAPRDNTEVLVLVRTDVPERMGYGGRRFVARWPDRYTGWVLFPGYAGVPDEWLAGWQPLPPAPARTEPSARPNAAELPQYPGENMETLYE